MCVIHHLNVGKRDYYPLRTYETVENYLLGCQETSLWHIGRINASLWVWTMGSSIPKSTWKEFENVQKNFPIRFRQVKLCYKLHVWSLLLLEAKSLPNEIKYMIKVSKKPHINFLGSYRKKVKVFKKTYTINIISVRWMYDMKKWFRWVVFCNTNVS